MLKIICDQALIPRTLLSIQPCFLGFSLWLSVVTGSETTHSFVSLGLKNKRERGASPSQSYFILLKAKERDLGKPPGIMQTQPCLEAKGETWCHPKIPASQDSFSQEQNQPRSRRVGEAWYLFPNRQARTKILAFSFPHVGFRWHRGANWTSFQFQTFGSASPPSCCCLFMTLSLWYNFQCLNRCHLGACWTAQQGRDISRANSLPWTPRSLLGTE